MEKGNEDRDRLKEACEYLTGRLDTLIEDKKCRDAVMTLLEAHYNAKSVIEMFTGQLERAYEVMDKVFKHPEIRKIMEDPKWKSET